MAPLSSHSKKTTFVLVGAAAIALGLSLLVAPQSASAAPAFAPQFGKHPFMVEPVRKYRRGRPPVYPYAYNPGRPGGWSTYFGFVPYARGDYEVQALQRAYPETNWPPSMRYWTPKSGF
jgi:hypothetical protein